MDKTERYVIVCDESTRHGKNYSYFFSKDNRYLQLNSFIRLFPIFEFGESASLL